MKSQIILVSVLAALAHGRPARNVLPVTSADRSAMASPDHSALSGAFAPLTGTDIYAPDPSDIPEPGSPDAASAASVPTPPEQSPAAPTPETEFPEISTSSAGTPEIPVPTEASVPDMTTSELTTPEADAPIPSNPNPTIETGNEDNNYSNDDSNMNSNDISNNNNDNSNNDDKDVSTKENKDTSSTLIDFESSSRSGAASCGSQRHIFSLAAGIGMAVWLTL